MIVVESILVVDSMEIIFFLDVAESLIVIIYLFICSNQNLVRWKISVSW